MEQGAPVATLRGVGNQLFKLKRYYSASKVYSKAIAALEQLQVPPVAELAMLYCNRSAAFQNCQLFSLALQDAEKSASLDPTYVKAYYRRALCLAQLLKYDQAMECLRRGLEIDPQNQELKTKFDQIKIWRDENENAEEENALGTFPAHLGHSSTKGRCYIASQDLPAGQLVLCAHPIAVTLEDNVANRYCNFCLKPINVCNKIDSSDSQPCQLCKLCVLCSTCAQNALANFIHANECKVLQAMYSSDAIIKGTRDMRTILRLMFYVLYNRQHDVTKDTTNVCVWDSFRELNELTHHRQQIPKPQVESFTRQVNNALMFIRDAGIDINLLWDGNKPGSTSVNVLDNGTVLGIITSQFVDYMCAIQSNGLSIQDPITADCIGHSLSPTASYFNHSCRPNCNWHFDNEGNICVRTMTDVKSGDELCISYIPTSEDEETKHEILQGLYHFQCACDYCKPVPFDYRTYLIPFEFSDMTICKNEIDGKLCEGNLIARPPSHVNLEDPKVDESSVEPVLKCLKCGKEHSTDYMNATQQLISKEVATLHSRGVDQLEFAKRSLDLFSKYLHPAHAMLFQLAQTLQGGSWRSGDYQALQMSAQLITQALLFHLPSPNVNEMAMEYLVLAHVARDQGFTDQSQDLFLKSLSIFETCVGADHWVVSVVRNNCVSGDCNVFGQTNLEEKDCCVKRCWVMKCFFENKY